MKYRVIIAEDELPIRQHIENLLSRHSDFEVVASVSNGDDLKWNLKNSRFDLGFFDIDLPVENTMDVLTDTGMAPPIIFVTAYADYAVQAFEIGAVDFLVKPFTLVRFEASLERAREYLKRNCHQPRQILWIKSEEKYLPLRTEEIIFVKADSKGLHINTESGVVKTNKTLSSFWSHLDRDLFCQVHRSYIVNKKCIKYMEPMFHGTYEISLKNHPEKIPVSRGYIKELKQEL